MRGNKGKSEEVWEVMGNYGKLGKAGGNEGSGKRGNNERKIWENEGNGSRGGELRKVHENEGE